LQTNVQKLNQKRFGGAGRVTKITGGVASEAIIVRTIRYALSWKSSAPPWIISTWFSQISHWLERVWLDNSLFIAPNSLQS